ncbi:invasion associated locus B family protein [Salipiger sp.]|uniref:invasion associated locus B family protein n=1 Tax=Salipiger sp. TaxID=2078585 RepID=UPI003A97E2DD
MTRLHSALWALPLVVGLSAAPAFAQDNAQSSETPAEQPADQPAEQPADQSDAQPQTSIGGPLSTGETDTPGSKQPETYTKSTHGDWEVQCLRVPEGTNAEDPCQMYQLLKDENGGDVAEVSVFRLQNGGQVVAGGTFVVPLETLLTQKLSITVDGGQAKRYDFSFCTQVGCYARVGFTADDVARFKAGSAATVAIVPALAPDQRVELDMSLSGFTAGFDETSKLRQ